MEATATQETLEGRLRKQVPGIKDYFPSKLNPGDKVVVYHGLNTDTSCQFEVIDQMACWVLVKPGIYGNQTAIFSIDKLVKV